MARHVEDNPVVALAGDVQQTQDRFTGGGVEGRRIALAGQQVQLLRHRGHEGLQHGRIDTVRCSREFFQT